MKRHFISIALAVVTLVLGSNLTFGFENKAGVPQKTSGNSATKINLININGATRAQLKKLPGIGDAEADKIIAGRPYATKSHLVTQNIIAIGVYENIKKLIIAKQPYKDGAKNAAIYRNNK
jgi:DNA uptake protein ComE-like DNA-binding protein